MMCVDFSYDKGENTAGGSIYQWYIKIRFGYDIQNVSDNHLEFSH